MIRFSCRKCGKSLRADEAIIGRSSRCTSCRAINRVPPQSTRKSGEKTDRVIRGSAVPVSNEDGDQFGDEVVTLIAESESDSFEAFENFDFSGLRFETPPVSPLRQPDKSPANAVAAETFSPQSLSTSKVLDTEAKSVSRSWGQKKSSSSGSTFSWRPQPSIPVQPLIALGAISLAAIIGYLGFLYFFPGPGVVQKTELQLSAVGNGHNNALFQVRKAERVMSSMELAYRQKNLPEAGLSVVLDVKQKAKDLVEADKQKMEQANRLYADGDKKGAHAILNAQIKSMQELQKEIEVQTRWLERKVFR